MQVPRPGTVIVYATAWCGYCRRLKRLLDGAGIRYAEIDVEQVPEAATYVMSVNDGNRTVPTVVFPDGSALTNPSLDQVKARMATA